MMATSASATSYFATVLPFRPTAINDFGQVVGSTSQFPGSVGGEIRLWTPTAANAVEGTSRTLFSATTNTAFTSGTIGLNNLGQVAAPAVNSNGSARIWTPTTPNNGTLPGTTRTLDGAGMVWAFNDAGTVITSPKNFAPPTAEGMPFFTRHTPTSATAYSSSTIYLPYPNFMPGGSQVTLDTAGRALFNVVAYESASVLNSPKRDYAFLSSGESGNGATTVLVDHRWETNNGIDMISALDMNDRGLIVGGDGYDAVIWTPDGAGGWTKQTVIRSTSSTVAHVIEEVNIHGQMAGSEFVQTPTAGYTPSSTHAWFGDSVETRVRFDDVLDPISGASFHVFRTEGLNIRGQAIVRARQSGTNAERYLLLTPGTPGDADFSGSADYDDLLTLARHYDGVAKTWRDGDFTGDGTVDFDDLLLLAQNYAAAEGGLASLSIADAAGFDDAFRADVALAQSLVPEPAATGMVAGAIAVLAGRRRRPQNA